ncbi:MAG: hypothetical protein RSF81_08120 [Oscillospiraceae bacterium]
MQVKVLQRFKDKETKLTHSPNDVITVNAQRFEYINSTELGQILENIEPPELPKEEQPPKPPEPPKTEGKVKEDGKANHK